MLCRSTATEALNPVRSTTPAGNASVMATRTGTRWTTFTQLPLAFCAGSRENCAPVPAPMLATTAVNLWPG